MSNKPTVEQFRADIRERVGDAVKALGQRAAAIDSERAARGNFSSRSILPFVDAFESACDQLASDGVAIARRYERAGLRHKALPSPLLEELLLASPLLEAAAKLAKDRGAFVDYSKLEDVQERLAAMPRRLEMAVGRYANEVDRSPVTGGPIPWTQKCLNFIGKYAWELAIAAGSTAIVAWLKLN
jgi:hypothetical protein